LVIFTHHIYILYKIPVINCPFPAVGQAQPITGYTVLLDFDPATPGSSQWDQNTVCRLVPILIVAHHTTLLQEPE